MLRKRVSTLVVALFMLAVFMGCATTGTQEIPWKKMTVTSYEIAGKTLGWSKNTVDSLLAMDQITAADHVKFMAVYEKTKQGFKTAGGTLDLAIDAKTAVDQKTYLDKYEALMTSFKKLVEEVIELINGFQAKALQKKKAAADISWDRILAASENPYQAAMPVAILALALNILILIGKLIPEVKDGVLALINMFKGIPVEDITDEEAHARIKAAIDELP